MADPSRQGYGSQAGAGAGGLWAPAHVILVARASPPALVGEGRESAGPEAGTWEMDSSPAPLLGRGTGAFKVACCVWILNRMRKQNPSVIKKSLFSMLFL